MESILKSIKKKKIPINAAVVISNKPNARGLNIAKKLGINTEVIESKGDKVFFVAKDVKHHFHGNKKELKVLYFFGGLDT